METVFLTTTNSRYIPVAEQLIKSLAEYQPDNRLFLIGINLSEDEKVYLKGLNSKLHIIEEKVQFWDKDEEMKYCAASRTWHLPKLVREYDYHFFWLDADVFLKDSIQELIDDNVNNGVDFMIRAKKIRPVFTCNSGMIWLRNTDKAKDILDWWEVRCREYKGKVAGLLADQVALNDTINKYWDDIKYENFPLKYNGIETNDESILVHMKGPTKYRLMNR
jgi:hypothetical protein